MRLQAKYRHYQSFFSAVRTDLLSQDMPRKEFPRFFFLFPLRTDFQPVILDPQSGIPFSFPGKYGLEYY
jgi:hypothetical protein